MAKAPKKVKWALGGDEPDDLAEFKDNDQIVKEMKGLPTKGVYLLSVKRMYVKPNKNDDDRIGVMMEIAEPKKSDSVGYNGYLVRDGFNITDQGTPFLKRFLKGLGLVWEDFYAKSKEQEDGDRRELVQMGRMKFGSAASKPVLIKALLKESPADDWNDDPYMEVVRYIPAEDAGDDDASDGEESVADMGSDEPVVVDKSDEVVTLEGLAKMKPKALAQFALDNGVKAKKVTAAGKDKEAIVTLIMDKMDLPPF